MIRMCTCIWPRLAVGRVRTPVQGVYNNWSIVAAVNGDRLLIVLASITDGKWAPSIDRPNGTSLKFLDKTTSWVYACLHVPSPSAHGRLSFSVKLCGRTCTAFLLSQTGLHSSEHALHRNEGRRARESWLCWAISVCRACVGVLWRAWVLVCVVCFAIFFLSFNQSI
jgi:hypothetical protein